MRNTISAFRKKVDFLIFFGQKVDFFSIFKKKIHVERKAQTRSRSRIW